MKLKSKKYTIRDFIAVPFSVSPWLSGLTFLKALITSLMPLTQIYLTAFFVNTAVAIYTQQKPAAFITLPLVLIIAQTVYTYVSGTLIGFSDARLLIRLNESFRGAITEKRARLEYRHIENNDTWDLVSRVCKDPAEQMDEGMRNLLKLIDVLIVLGSILSTVIAQVWWAGLLITACSVPLVIISVKTGQKEYSAYKEAKKHLRRAQYLQTILTGRENVEERAMFGYSAEVNKKWLERSEIARKITLRMLIKASVTRRSSSLSIVGIAALISAVLLVPLQSGELSLGMFIGIVTAIFHNINYIAIFIAGSLSRLAQNKEFLKDLTQFAALSEQSGALDKPSVPYGFDLEKIEFRDVSFAYPGTDTDILRHFSLTLYARTQYAIVGVNGAGKTTVTKLLTGLYDNYRGEIFVNGKNLREYSLAQRKAMYSIIYQDYARYCIEARGSIALGNVLGVTDAELDNAVRLSGLSEAMASLPEGLDTPLGKIRSGGVDVSGGQWQRIAIARALVSHAQLTILDEPTAALDPVAESRVYELFGRISSGKSTLFITHRLGAARLADEIIVIDGGRVAEQGSHRALMEKKGLYTGMFESQRSWYE